MLVKKMLRDLRYHKTSFIAIFLMTFLGMFIYSGLNSEWNGMKVSAQEYYERVNLADAWLMGGNYTNADIEEIKEEFKDIEGRTYIPLTLSQDTSKKLDGYALDDQNISKMEIVEGIAYDQNQDGVWLDVLFANENSIKVGNTVTFNVEGFEIEKKVLGLVRSGEYIFSQTDGQMMPNHKMNGYAFLAKQQVPLLANIPYNQLVIKTDLNKNDIQDIVESNEALKGSTLLMRSEHTSVATLDSEVQQHKAMSDIFPIAFLLIGFLTTITTMSKLTMDQRTQIGILQALGFPYRKILFHYISHGFVICTLGCILGYVCGPLLFPPLVYPMLTTMYDIPNLHGVAVENGVYLLFLCVLIAFLISFSTCRKQLRDKPAKTMRPSEIKINTMPILRKFNSSNHFSFTTKWNLRDILRNKLRSFMTIFGVMGCSALIFCSSGLFDTMTKLPEWMYQELSEYETKVTLDETLNMDEKRVLKQELQGEFLYEGAIELQYEKERKTASITVQESTDLLHIQNAQKDNLTLDDTGIALSKKTADSLDIQIGDQISWRLYGKDTWHTSVVNLIIRTPIAQGLTMSVKYFETFEEFSPQSIITSKTSINSMNGISNISEKASLIHDLDSMMEAMITMIAILVLAAIVLGSVVLYNLGTLSFLERQRELATLKVLGFSTKKCKKLLSQQNSWLTIIGILLGIPCGYGLIWVMIITIGESMDVLIQIEITTYVYSILGTYIVSYLIQLCLAKKLKTIDMVSALKSNE